MQIQKYKEKAKAAEDLAAGVRPEAPPERYKHIEAFTGHVYWETRAEREANVKKAKMMLLRMITLPGIITAACLIESIYERRQWRRHARVENVQEDRKS